MGLHVRKLDSTSGKDVLKGSATSKIIIGADLVATQYNAELFAANAAEMLIGAELCKIRARR